MNDFEYRYKWITNKLSHLVMIILSLVLIMSASFTFMNKVNADKDDSKEISFYKVASAAASYYDNVYSSTEKEFNENFNGSNINFASAGDFVGFRDEDFEKGFFGSKISRLSSAAQSRGYNSFKENSTIRQYVEYGHALNAIGIDSVTNRTFDMIGIVRMLAGLVVMFMYSLALMTDLIFKAVVTVLKLVNPFSWLWAGLGAFDAYLDAGQSNAGIFTDLAGRLKDIFATLKDLGFIFTVFAFFIGIGIALLSLRGVDKIKSHTRAFVTRLLFLGFAVPVLGGLYTISLEQIDSGVTSVPFANQVIGSTFVDFEYWLKYSSLALPKGVNLKVNLADHGGAGSVEYSGLNLNSLAAKINASSTDLQSGGTNIGDSTFDAQRVKNQIATAYDMIGRYMGGSFYGPSDFETFYRSRIPTGEMVNIAKDIKTASDYENYQKEDTINMDGSPILKKKESSLNFLGDEGDVRASTSGHSIIFSGNSGGRTAEARRGDFNNIEVGNGSSPGFSSLTKYNYLTTDFSDSSITTYSSRKATSGLVVSAHRSVNIVGTGVLGLMMWLKCVVILSVLTVIGISYAIGMFINNLMRGIKIISHLPFALIGFFKAMAQVVVWSMIMIVEIIGTIFTYQIVATVFMILNGTFSNTLQEQLESVTGNTASLIPGVHMASSYTTVLVGTLVLIIFDIAFLIGAIRMRKSTIKAVDSLLAGSIDRLFQTDGVAASAASGGSGTDTLGRAAAVGAGAYGATKYGGKVLNAVTAPGGELNKIGQALGYGMKEGEDQYKSDVATGDDAIRDKEFGNTQSGIEGVNRQRITYNDDDKDGNKSPERLAIGTSSSEANKEAIKKNESLKDTGEAGSAKKKDVKATDDKRPEYDNKDSDTSLKTKDVKGEVDKTSSDRDKDSKVNEEFKKTVKGVSSVKGDSNNSDDKGKLSSKSKINVNETVTETVLEKEAGTKGKSARPSDKVELTQIDKARITQLKAQRGRLERAKSKIEGGGSAVVDGVKFTNITQIEKAIEMNQESVNTVISKTQNLKSPRKDLKGKETVTKIPKTKALKKDIDEKKISKKFKPGGLND